LSAGCRHDTANPGSLVRHALAGLVLPLLLWLAIVAHLHAVLDVADADAQPCVANPTFANDGSGHLARLIDGNGKAVGAARSYIDEGVDADDLALQVDERPARIAGIDLRVGLDVLAHPFA
jgi:hypothetical protein